MTKLYLIRRNLETFAGPMSVSEMKESYQSLQFGLQDEVSGHCGPWVTFEDSNTIRKHYPDVARIVLEDLASWGVSDPGVRVPGAPESQRQRGKTSSGLAWAIILLIVAAMALICAVYLAVSGRISGFGRDSEVTLTVEDLQLMLDRQDFVAFNRGIDNNISEIVDRTMRSKKPELQWLPYLRYYAFEHEGAIDGLSGRMLRGDATAGVPVDCSVKIWRKRWRTAIKSMNELVTSRKLVRTQWSRILSWDPHWIRRREHKGWLLGGNYYLGCLMMADQALTDIFSDSTLVTSAGDWEKLGVTKVKARLTWLLEVTRDGTWNQPLLPNAGNILSLWTCYEGAHEIKQLSQCRDAVPVIDPPDGMQSYSDERFGWNLLRLTVAYKGTPPSEVIQALSQLLPKNPKGDLMTRFDYRPELKLWKSLIKEAIPVEKALEKVQLEFPDVHLSH